jgi:amylovoran biosynthesis glycosyltransferase AmsB
LNSIVSQTHKPYEVIIIDDGSEDYQATLAIIEQFGKMIRIIFLRNPLNSNGAFSRNRGIDIATGDYVAFLDSDDMWETDRLETAKKLLYGIENENCIVYGRFELFNQEGVRGVLLPLRAIESNELVSEYVFAAGQQMQTSTFVCPLDLAKSVKFDTTLSRHQDSDFMMRAQAKGAFFIFQDKKCSFYYFSRSDMFDRIRSARINKEFCINFLESKSEYFSSKSKAGYQIIVYSRLLYLQGEKLKALFLIVKFLPNLGFSNFFDLLKSKIAIRFSAKMLIAKLVFSAFSLK